MNTRLNIQVDGSSPAFLVLRLTGDLDSRGAPELMSAWRRSRQSGQGTIINLSDVYFASSSGVGVLLAIVEESQDIGSAVFLVAPSPNMMAVFRLLGLERFLPLRPSEDAAQAA